MKQWLYVMVLALVAATGAAVAQVPEPAASGLEGTSPEAAAPTLEEIFAVDDAKILAATYQCWVTCDDGSWTVFNVSGVLQCRPQAVNFCGGQGCEFVVNNLQGYC